jgi:hypothetical protein
MNDAPRTMTAKLIDFEPEHDRTNERPFLDKPPVLELPIRGRSDCYPNGSLPLFEYGQGFVQVIRVT